MESLQDALHSLKVQLHGYPWFAQQTAKHDSLHNAIVAYVHLMNREIETLVPLKVDGWDVRAHFVGSANTLSTAEKKSAPLSTAHPVAPVVVQLLQEEPEFTTTLDIHNEIWKLRRVCGKENLTDIFYEIHDGDDAVTNHSEQFPLVREKLQSLYNEFGFDLLFEEIDDFGNFP